MFGCKLEMDPGLGIGRGDWLEFLNGPRLGNPGGLLVGNSAPPAGLIGWRFCQKHGSELLGEVNGDVSRRSKGGCCLVQRTGP